MLRRIVQFASVVGAVLGVGGVGAGCLDRPVTASGATTKTNFTASVVQNAIDKVDILFDIDNSASMGDKQAFLAAAVPDLVTRLVQPNCVMVDTTTGVSTVVGLSNNGSCTSGTIEFPPVHNMHLGIISSSLGTRGVTGAGAVCDPSLLTNPFNDPGMHPAISAHDDDRAELLSRTAMDHYTEGTSPDTGGQNFLDWFPTGTGWTVNDPPKSATNGVPQATSPTATAIISAMQLETDFTALIIGAHYYGCGIESQLESWYRFLIQPDPYDSIAITTAGLAAWSGVDATIIKQRHDFLRPDSLVAIIDLSDEDDSEIDVRSFGGQGYKFMDDMFQPPRGTSACAASPGSATCTSCAYGGTTASDPNCKMGPYTATDDPGFYINVRHVNMQQKYGIIPQFPLGRYVLGLTSPNVPDRDHEYPAGASSYQGGTVYAGTTLKDAYNLNCTNPLFANTLPDGSDLSPTALCNQSGAGGVRTAGLVYYAHIGGVPHQLLQTVLGKDCPAGITSQADCPQKDTLASTDWATILGKGWATPPAPPSAPNVNAYDNAMQDPHMIEAFAPRPGLVALTTGPNPTGGGSDAVNGGEWVTNGLTPVTHSLPVDREYACIFPLVDPTTGTPQPRDCTSTDYSVQEACDCSVAGLPLDAVPAVCGTQSGGPFASGSNEYTKQYYAKAYPTTREITLVELMGGQGILSSLCPIHVTAQGASDPLFGYRPAVTAIVNRLKNSLSSQCLPQQLNPTPTTLDGGGTGLEVQCLVLATLANNPQNAVGMTGVVCNHPEEGMSVPGPTEAPIVKAFQAAQHAAFLAPPNSSRPPDPSTLATCLVNQIPYTSSGSCASAGSGSPRGWCYVTDSMFTGTCAQAVQFTPNAPASGATVSLQCIEAQVNVVGGNDGGGG
jgi:hypothetical protein